jgi:hypothetical protein
MAWDFAAEISALTGFNADYNTDSPTGETYRVHTTQWLTDSAKEVISALPEDLLKLCASQQTFTSGSADTLNTGKILEVFRNDGDIDQPCRKVDSFQKGRFSDSEDMNYATVTDPVYYVENNSIDVLPVGGSCKYSEVQYPSVAYNDTAISVFPDEAERTVVLSAAIKAAEYMLANEEDIELLNPVIAQLKDDYQKELARLK